MIKYWGFLRKSTIRNKFNFFPIIILAVIAIFLLIMNMSVQSQVNFVGEIQSANKVNNQLVGQYNETLKEKLSNSDRKGITKAKNSLKKQIDQNNISVTAANNGNWKKALQLQVNVLINSALKDLNKHPQDNNSQQKIALKGTILKYQYLASHNLKPDTDTQEVQGFPYMYRIMQSLFPILVILCLITVLTNIFTNNFRDGVNIDDIFPFSNYRLTLSKVSFGILISVAIYSIIAILSLLTSGVINGFNSLEYPIVRYVNHSFRILNIGSVMSKAFLLQILVIVFVTLFVYIIANLSKNRIATLFTSILVLNGGALIITKIVPLYGIIHLIPLTYFNSVDVVDYSTLISINNSAVNFLNGVIVMLIWILIEVLFIYFWSLRSKHSTN